MNSFTSIVRHIPLFAVGAMLTAEMKVSPQPVGRTPAELTRIVDVALQAVMPLDKLLTSYTVAERGIRFDKDRTMAAFGYDAAAAATTKLELARAVSEGTSELLRDCDQQGTKLCANLGSSAYVYIEPISLTQNEAVLWVHTKWSTKMLSGQRTPQTRAFLSSASTKVYLARNGGGTWRFVRVGVTVTG